MHASMSPCKDKSVILIGIFFMLLPLQGAFVSAINPGLCPGLGAFGLTARFDRPGRKRIEVKGGEG